jgi:hypothetical protein
LARSALLLSCIAAVIAAGGATTAGAETPPPVPSSAPSRIEVLPIVARVVGERTLIARVDSGYCLGNEYRPAIERITLAWQRSGPEAFSAVLRARVRTPTLSSPPGRVPRAGEGPSSVVVCAGLALSLEAKVALPQPLRQVTLFDGSYSPPRLMRRRGPSLAAEPDHS